MAERATPIFDEWLRAELPVASKGWGAILIDQTLALPTLSGTCALEVEFVRPGRLVQFEAPGEATLDKLLRRLLDVLEGTVLRTDRMLRSDGELASVEARLRIAKPGERTGIHLVLRELAPSARGDGPRSEVP